MCGRCGTPRTRAHPTAQAPRTTGQQSQVPGKAQSLALGAVTYNGSSWKSIKEYLNKLPADIHVVFLQEHRVVEEGIEHASQWAAKRGWKSIWSAAKPCQQKGPASGGVAILVRDGRLREADSGAGVYTVTEASTSSLNGEYVAIATAESRYLYRNLKGAVMRSAAGAWRLYRSAGATVPEYTSTTNAPTPPTGHWKSPSNGHCAVRKA